MSALKWGERKGKWRRVEKGVYAEGPEEPTELDRQRARVLASGGVASGGLAGVLHGLDSVTLDDRPVRRRALPEERVVTVHGVRCADGLQTLTDLATTLDDDTWEQALESALRKRLVRTEDLPLRGRIRRVLERRPPGAPPTGSVLETLMIQLIRRAGLPDPVRQLQVGPSFLDISWPHPGLFLELDGQQHKDQPVYDARRETAIVAATGWLPGRFTWREVVHLPVTTARRVTELFEQAGGGPEGGDEADDQHGHAAAHGGARQLTWARLAGRAHQCQPVSDRERTTDGEHQPRQKVGSEKHAFGP